MSDVILREDDQDATDAATEDAASVAAEVVAQAGDLVRQTTSGARRLAEVGVVAVTGYPPHFAATWAALAEVALGHSVLLTARGLVLVVVAPRGALTGLLTDRGVAREALESPYEKGAHATVLVVGTADTLLLVTAEWPPEVAGPQAKRASLRLVKE